MISRFAQFSNSISGIYHAVQKIERMEMEKFGLKGPHAQCLLAMFRNPEGVTSSQLCVLCEKDKAAISRTVSELEKEGMVCRETHGGNGCRAVLRLTRQGREAAAQVSELVAVVVEKAGKGLTDIQRKVFYQVLSAVAGNLKSICTEGLSE